MAGQSCPDVLPSRFTQNQTFAISATVLTPQIHPPSQQDTPPPRFGGSTPSLASIAVEQEHPSPWRQIPPLPPPLPPPPSSSGSTATPSFRQAVAPRSRPYCTRSSSYPYPTTSPAMLCAASRVPWSAACSVSRMAGRSPSSTPSTSIWPAPRRLASTPSIGPSSTSAWSRVRAHAPASPCSLV